MLYATKPFKDSNAYVSTEIDLKVAINTTNIKWGSNNITSILNSILNSIFQGTYPQKLSYGWYNYYPTLSATQADGLQAAHMLKANSEGATIIRENKGNSYARLHLTDVKYADLSNASSATTWTFELDIQPSK